MIESRNEQPRVMLEASRLGATVFRNNVGIAHYPDGSRVAYGLCPGSSDLIGWAPLEITPDMVGQTVAVFLAIEVKAGSRKPSDKQQHFLDQVNSAGGIAFVARCEADVERELREKWQR